MKKHLPCGRCGVEVRHGTLFCPHCGHQPWAHPRSCECGTCAPLLRLAIDAKDLALGGGVSPRAIDGGKVGGKEGVE